MGLPENAAKRALIKSGNIGAEAAVNWYFNHVDDKDLNDPIDEAYALWFLW